MIGSSSLIAHPFGIPAGSILAMLFYSPRWPQGCQPTNNSISLRYEPSAFQRGIIIVRSFFRAFRHLHFLPGGVLIMNEAQEMRDAVEACPLLVVGSYDVPRCFLNIGCLQHHVAGPGVVIPAGTGG